MIKSRLDPGGIEVVDEAVVIALRGMQPWERVAMIGYANRGVRELLGIGVRRSHPEWSEAQVGQEVARLMLDDDELWENVQQHRRSSISTA